MEVTIGERRTLTFKAAGGFSYFPTFYPQDGAIFVGNLDYIFESFGGLMPYDVWLKTAPGAESKKIIEGLQEQGVAVIQVQDARAALEQVMGAPNRQGVLGLLSVGFLASAALTIAGFLLYALLVYRERLITLGVLRAIGLSARQMSASVVLEQAFLILSGLAGGLAIGVLAAYLFIPHMPVAFDRYPGTPPFTVEIAMGGILRMYGRFCGLLVLGTIATLWSLSRMKIFQAVKLGENL
jgi:putative ABC transport system permease protein